MATVTFPDGSRVRASSLAERIVDDPERSFGLYLDAHWEPTWPATVVDWEDFGLPEHPELAAQQIADAFDRRQGGLVEVGCLGGSGRTGTVLACMAVLAGVEPTEAVAWVRAAYRPEAVETADQEAWVRWFAEWASRGRMATRIDWDPQTYVERMLAEFPGYEELQDAVAAAAQGTSVLELGVGTGETALRVLARNPGAAFTGIDASEAMIARARERLPRATLRVQRLEDRLPPGSFEVVVSALAVHHLDGAGKRDLFRRVAEVTRRFVLGDVVVPERPEQATIQINPARDRPSTVAEHLRWLDQAGFAASARELRPDLALFVARR